MSIILKKNFIDGMFKRKKIISLLIYFSFLSCIFLHSCKDHNVDEEGNSRLHIAALGNEEVVVENFLKSNDNPNIKNLLGISPLHYACQGEKALPIVKLLIKYGADYNAMSNNNSTPLHFAAYNGKPEVVSYLVSKGACLDFKDENGQTPLFYAIRNTKDENVIRLVELGADIWIKDHFYNWPYDYAKSQKNTEIIDFLIENTDFDKRDKDGYTILHLAVLKEDYDLTKFLLDHGADPNLTDLSGKNAYDLVKEYHPENIKLNELLKATDNKKPSSKEFNNIPISNQKYENFDEDDKVLFAAIYDNDIEIVKKIISLGINLDFLFLGRITPLQAAVINQDYEITRVLIENNADVDMRNKENSTALHLASASTSKVGIDILQLLLEANADPNLCDTQGSPLFQCVGNDNVQGAKLLLKYGCDVNKKGYDGNTALHHSIMLSKQNFVEFLIKNNANINILNNNKQSPFDVLMELECDDSIKYNIQKMLFRN
ncbi:MAG: hypothetical protein GF364_03735 [Candidatus Lokiarchaeota archaeon]|nr:hypothetical protein [Candidatus Lokiarchaeota archaeon]